MRRSNQGFAALGYVFIFLWIATLAAWFFVVFQPSVKTQDELQKNKKELKAQTDRVKMKEERLIKLSNLVGFRYPLSEGGILLSNPDLIIEKINDICNDKDGIKATLGLNLPLASREDEGMIKKIKLSGDSYVKDIIKIEQICKEETNKIEELQKEITNLKDTLEKKKEEHQKEVNETQSALKTFYNSVNEETQKIIDLRKSYNQKLQDEEKLRAEAQSEKFAKKEEFANLLVKQRDQNKKYEKELENLIQRIEELQTEAVADEGAEVRFREIDKVKKQLYRHYKKSISQMEKIQEDIKKIIEQKNILLTQETNRDEKTKLTNYIALQEADKANYEQLQKYYSQRLVELEDEGYVEQDLSSAKDAKDAKDTKTSKLQDSPDGEIIYVNDKMKIAYIDLGRREGVMIGLKFNVFRYGKGGRKELKGEIIVKEVKENMSMVGITKLENSLDPVSNGDKIINVVYDRNKIKYFVVVGRLTQKYSLTQISRLVEKIGGRIEDMITAKTDFLILGEDFEKDPIYEKGKEMGIETMMESEFLNYLGD